MLTRLLAYLIVTVIRLLRRTWRVHIIEQALVDTRKSVFCFWHGQQAGLLRYPHRHRTAVLTSLSKDGTLQACIMRGMGYEVYRGSSSKSGAIGLKAIIAGVRNGESAAFAVDGPRGPLHAAKPGAIKAAQLGQAPVVPISCFAERAWVFEKAWDKFMLPKPFAKVVICAGQPQLADHMTTADLTMMIQRCHANCIEQFSG